MSPSFMQRQQIPARHNNSKLELDYIENLSLRTQLPFYDQISADIDDSMC
ncbi:hypothetical protein GCM10025794_33360 [Massilia kyonggiensis]